MAILVISAPEDHAQAYAQAIGNRSGFLCRPMTKEACREMNHAQAVLLILPNYYSRGFWQMKTWLSTCLSDFHGKFCACLCVSPQNGGELALRSILSQLMPTACLMGLCAVVCADGRIRLGGNCEISPDCMPLQEYCTSLEQIVGKIR